LGSLEDVGGFEMEGGGSRCKGVLEMEICATKTRFVVRSSKNG
jgi:hypothetical protein